MKAIASISGGVCVLEPETANERVISIPEFEEIPRLSVHVAYGLSGDWESVEADGLESLIGNLRERYSRLRAVLNVEACLLDITEELKHDLLEEVEENLQFAGERSLKSQLLRAPLLRPDDLREVVSACLSRGYSASAALLEDVRELQPHLRRLVAKWSALPRDCFSAFDYSADCIWRTAVEAGAVLDIIESANASSAAEAWGRLAFCYASPSERAGIAAIQRALVEALFPGESHVPVVTAASSQVPDESLADISGSLPETRRNREALERALKQVDAVAREVEGGNDAKAVKFLRELVEDQMRYRGGEQYVVKSLCNIAKQCAEMFRADFEYECLRRAIEILPSDPWAYTQLADHYKRAGDFDSALITLAEAERLGDDRITMSSRADVYAHMGQLARAMEIYGEIPGGDLDPAIRTARADLHRRFGDLASAEREYDAIIRDGQESDRVIAGKAEVAKRRGDLGTALRLYESLLAWPGIDEFAVHVYRMGIANVLLRKGEFEQAYQHVDAAVQGRPFSSHARSVRAAIVGLMGKPEEAVADVPNVGQTQAYNEWIRGFVRGSLLLMLGRHADARAALLEQLQEQFVDPTGRGLLRLGAAVCLLQTRDGVEQASIVLEQMPDVDDTFSEYLRDALQYHVATALRDDRRAQELERRLRQAPDEGLKGLALAIKSENWKKVCQLEVQTLLRLAA